MGISRKYKFNKKLTSNWLSVFHYKESIQMKYKKTIFLAFTGT